MSLYDAITKKMEEDKKAKALNSTVQKPTPVQFPAPAPSKPITSILSDTINQLSNMKPVEPVKRNVGTFAKTPDIAKGTAKGFSMALQTADKVISPIVQPLRDWSQTPTGQSVKGALTSGGIGSLLSALPKTMVSPTKVTEPLQVLADRGVNSATFGALDYLMPETQAEKFRQENHPIASTIGTLGGYIIPGVGAEKLVAKALPSLGTKVGESLLMRGSKNAATGGITGFGMGSIEGGLNAAANNQDILKGSLKGGIEGAAIGGALGGIIGGVGSKLEANKIFNKGLSDVGNSIDNYKFPQIREPQILPLPDSMARGPRVSAEIPPQYRQPLPKLNEPLMLNSPKGTYLKPLEQKTFTAKNVDTPITESSIALKNKPMTLKNNIPPSEYSNISKEDLTKLKKEMLNEKGQIFSDQVEWLNSKSSRGNKSTKGNLYWDEGGNVTGGGKGFSNNELWYQEWSKNNRVWNDETKKWNYRKPTQKEIKEIAEKQLSGGVDSNFGQIPKNDYYSELTNRISKIDEILNTPASKIIGNVNVKQIIPYDVTTLQKKPSFSLSGKIEELKTSTEKKNPFYVDPKFRKEIAGVPARPTRVEKPDPPVPQTKKRNPLPNSKNNAQKQALNASKIEPNIKSPLNKVEPVKTQNKSIETDDIRIVDGEIFYKDIHATTSKRGNAIFTNKKSFFSGERKILELPKSLDSSNINTANMVKPIDNVSTNKPNLSTKVEPDIATGKTKNRQFIENSYMESDVTTPKMKAEMKNKIPEYPEISNQKTLDEANKIIGDDVDGNAKRFLEQQELNSALDTAKGISLIQKAIAKGDVNLANDISINLAEKLTTAGQTVQAASIFKRMTPEGMLQYANKQISKYNSANPTKKISGLTEAEASKIVENMNLINAANNGELKLLKINLQLFAETKLAEIFKLIGNKIPADMGQKLRAFQRINLLLNPKTMVRNVTGNVFSGTVGNLSDTLRAGLDKGISKITGKRTALLPNLKTQLKGAKKGFDRVKSDWINDVNTSPTGTQYELGQGQNAASPFKNKPLKFLDKITTTGLRFGDDPFYQGFYDDALQQQMKIAKVTEPTSDMIKQADQIARERTFQDTNYMTKLFSAFQRGLNHVGTQNFGLGNIVLPFVKTPANILARALEYSPVEIGKGITKALYDAGKGNAFNQYKLVDSLAKGLTGTALLGAGYELAKRGIITGNAPKDTDTRKYMEANGILPYSFKMGDGSYTYDWAQPSSIPIAIGADIYYNLKDKKDPANALLSAGESGIQTLMSQSLVQGLTKFFGGGQYGSSIGENLINTGLSSATQFVPFSSLLRNTAEVIDPVKRNTYDSESQLNSYLVNPIKNTIPGFRQKLPEKVNTFGEKTPASGFIDTFINPAREGIGTKVDTKVNDELMRLSKVGQNKQFPTLANKTISYKLTPKGETKKLILPPKQLSEYQQKLGLKNLEAIKKTISSGNYQMANDKQKADMISNEMSKVKQQLETELLKQQNISEYKSSSGGRSLRSVRSGRTGR